jgi:hypothetical protein
VIDVEGLSVESLTIELLPGKRSVIRVLKADESVHCFSVLGEDLHTLNLSIFAEVLLKLLVSSVGREIFDVKIASLFGVLEPQLLLLLLYISLILLKSIFDIECKTIYFFTV